MSNAMGIHTFYCYQVGWYVFATIVSILAALLFWNKGSVIIETKKFKAMGATGIFILILYLFFYINPLKPLSDYKKILIIYGNTADHESNATNPIIYTIKISKFEGNSIKLNPNDLAIEMAPFKSIYSLSPTLDDCNTFKTLDKIPPGNYRVILTQKGTGKSMTFQLDVP